MKFKTAVLGFAVLIGAKVGLAGFAAEEKKAQAYLDYDEFEQVRALDPNLANARLSGMNKTCMRLWKNGEMLVREGGMVVRGDFNNDGVPDVGLAMEKDVDPAGKTKDYLEMLATKQKDGWHLLQTVPLSGNHAIIETSWDQESKRIGIDTGERHLISESAVTMQTNGKLLGGFHNKTGDVEIMLTYLQWHPDEKKFHVSRGLFKQ